MLKSKILCRQSKKQVLAYTCEIWSTTKGDEENIACFERRVLKIIYEPILENGEELMKKYNEFSKNPEPMHISY